MRVWWVAYSLHSNQRYQQSCWLFGIFLQCYPMVKNLKHHVQQLNLYFFLRIATIPLPMGWYTDVPMGGRNSTLMRPVFSVLPQTWLRNCCHHLANILESDQALCFTLLIKYVEFCALPHILSSARSVPVALVATNRITVSLAFMNLEPLLIGCSPP